MNRFFFSLLLCLSFMANGFSQSVLQNQNLNIGIIAPLYLDSAFKSDPNKIPAISKSGLDFVQGAMIALDTIRNGASDMEVHIIDSKDSIRNIPWMIRYGRLDKMNLLIGSIKDPEYQELANFALAKKIPLISVTYPNDGGIRDNPWLVIVNSTLESHIQGIYNYLVQQFSNTPILLLKRRNDDRIDDMFQKFNRGTSNPPLKIRSIAVDSINSDQLAMLIDTTKQNVIIGASLSEGFSVEIADACYPLQVNNSKITLIGMPNWDGFKAFYDTTRFHGFPILFTTPHTDEERNAFTSFLGNQYFDKYRIRPSDMAFKGFEATYYFTNILIQFRDSFMQHLNEPQFAPFHPFNFQPVYLTSKEKPDYYENRRVSVVKILNGVISKR